MDELVIIDAENCLNLKHDTLLILQKIWYYDSYINFLDTYGDLYGRG